MRVRGWTVAIVGLAMLAGCKRREAAPGEGAASPAAQAAPAQTVPPTPQAMPTPPPAPIGAVSEIRTVAGMAPAQVIAMLPGRKETSAASDQDCASDEQASLHCVDLVVAGLPKGKSVPSVLAYAKKKGDRMFQGPCREAGDAVDCATVLGAKLGAPSVRLAGRKPRLEFTGNSVLVRWRAMNFASEDMDVKLVVFF